ncbi:unnamed protein product [Lactuca virosa]|uniref:Uncharacterized protein n=1 Tax=Lactuca virosa TaxID=75947 RepID=A0AAU9MW63_9ASTR|nr:unnamed protein product [Lactuca virosa]
MLRCTMSMSTSTSMSRKRFKNKNKPAEIQTRFIYSGDRIHLVGIGRRQKSLMSRVNWNFFMASVGKEGQIWNQD